MTKTLILFAAALLATAAEAQTARQVGSLPRAGGRPLQAVAGLETEYGEIRTSEGARLRTIATRPARARGRLPAIMLIQWVSCSSVDFDSSRRGLLRDLATESGLVLLRVERAGTGDSEGVPCAQLDYDTEVRHYREALAQLARHRWVDPARIVLFGSSLGATTAPLVAAGSQVAGIVVQGGGALTYVERMINFDRVYLERSGRYSPGQIHEEMVRRIPFHVEYLLGRRTPEQIERERPELAGVWASVRGSGPGSHYGRPYAWHWQAAATDFLEAWTNVRAPVLVLYGEYDQFETRHGHRLIADTLNRLRPGSATFVEVPRADHDLDLFASADDAYAYRGPRPGRDAFLPAMLDWIRRTTRSSR